MTPAKPVAAPSRASTNSPAVARQLDFSQAAVGPAPSPARQDSTAQAPKGPLAPAAPSAALHQQASYESSIIKDIVNQGVVPYLFAQFMKQMRENQSHYMAVRAFQKIGSTLAAIPFTILQMIEIVGRVVGFVIVSPVNVIQSGRKFYKKQFIDLTGSSIVNLYQIWKQNYLQFVK